MKVLFMPGFMGIAEDAPFGFEGFDWQKEAPNEVVDRIAHRIDAPVHLVGYSMGARVALSLAAAHPEKVRRLVLLSANPGIEDPSARNQRLQADRRLAKRIRINFEAVLAGWYEQPVFEGLREFDKERLLGRRAGQNPWQVARWLECWSVGRMREGWSHLANLPMPILALAGARDAKYLALAQQMAQTTPQCHAEIVAEAGHILQVDQPDETQRLIAKFLETA